MGAHLFSCLRLLRRGSEEKEAKRCWSESLSLTFWFPNSCKRNRKSLWGAFQKALVLMCHVSSHMWQTRTPTPLFSSSSSPHAWPAVCVRTDSVIVRKIAVVLTGGSLGNRGPQHDGIRWALKSCLPHFYGDTTLRNAGPNDLYLVYVLATGVLPWIQESEGEGS